MLLNHSLDTIFYSCFRKKTRRGQTLLSGFPCHTAALAAPPVRRQIKQDMDLQRRLQCNPTRNQ